MTPVPAFDYACIPDTEDRAVVQNIAAEIIEECRQTAASIIVIGKRLNGVKELLPHGQWGPWLKAEFGWSQRWANACRAAAIKFGDKLANTSNLGPTLLMELATGCSDELVGMAVEGGLTVRQVKELKRNGKSLGAKPPREASPAVPNGNPGWEGEREHEPRRPRITFGGDQEDEPEIDLATETETEMDIDEIDVPVLAQLIIDATETIRVEWNGGALSVEGGAKDILSSALTEHRAVLDEIEQGLFSRQPV